VKPALRATVSVVCAGSIAIQACAMDRVPVNERNLGDQTLDRPLEVVDSDGNTFSTTLRAVMQAAWDTGRNELRAEAEQGVIPHGADRHDYFRDNLGMMWMQTQDYVNRVLSFGSTLDMAGHGILLAQLAGNIIVWTAYLTQRHLAMVGFARGLGFPQDEARWASFVFNLPFLTGYKQGLKEFNDEIQEYLKDRVKAQNGRKLSSDPNALVPPSVFGSYMRVVAYNTFEIKTGYNENGDWEITYPAIGIYKGHKIVMPLQVRKLIKSGNPFVWADYYVKYFDKVQKKDVWGFSKRYFFNMEPFDYLPTKIVGDGERLWMLSTPGKDGFKVHYRYNKGSTNKVNDWLDNADPSHFYWWNTLPERHTFIDIYPGRDFVWAVKKNGDIFYCKQSCYGDWKPFYGKGFRVAVSPTDYPDGKTNGKRVMVWVLGADGRIYSRPEDANSTIGWSWIKNPPPRVVELIHERDPVKDWNNVSKRKLLSPSDPVFNSVKVPKR
jgi:hypothetical protein